MNEDWLERARQRRKQESQDSQSQNANDTTSSEDDWLESARRRREQEEQKSAGSEDDWLERARQRRYEEDAKKVDDSYINTFFDDAVNYIDGNVAQYNQLNWGNASATYQTAYDSWKELDYRRNVVQKWLELNKDYLDQTYFNDASAFLKTLDSDAQNHLSVFQNEKDYYSQWDTEEDYNAYIRNQEMKAADPDALRAELKDLEEQKAARIQAFDDADVVIGNEAGDLESQKFFKDLEEYDAQIAEKRQYLKQVLEVQRPVAENERYQQMLSADADALKAELKYLEDLKAARIQAFDDADVVIGTEAGDLANQAFFKDLEKYDAQITEKRQYLNKVLEVQEWTAANEEYQSLMSAEDFAEKSKYVSTANGRERSAMEIMMDSYSAESSGWDDPLYEYINGNKEAGVYLSDMASTNYGPDNALGSFYGRSTENNAQSQQMTKDEVAIFNYLYATQGKEAAHAYYDHLQSPLNARQRAADEAYAREYAKKHPVLASAFSVVTSPLKGLSYVGQINDYLDDGKIDQNAAYNKFSYNNSAIRGQVSQMIEESGKWGKVGSFAYNTGMSMGDFLMTTAVTGGNGTASMLIMGSGAAADTTIAAKDRGLSDEQAFQLGTVSGLAEALCERVSLGTLLDGDLLRDSAGKYILKNMIAEGLEEVTTSGVNLVADILISKDQSQWQQSINGYMELGYDEETAFGMAMADQAMAMGLDFLGGFFSGGVISSVGVGFNKLGDRSGSKQIDQGSAPVGADGVQQRTDRADVAHAPGREAPVSLYDDAPSAQEPAVQETAAEDPLWALAQEVAVDQREAENARQEDLDGAETAVDAREDVGYVQEQTQSDEVYEAVEDAPTVQGQQTAEAVSDPVWEAAHTVARETRQQQEAPAEEQLTDAQPETVQQTKAAEKERLIYGKYTGIREIQRGKVLLDVFNGDVNDSSKMDPNWHEELNACKLLSRIREHIDIDTGNQLLGKLAEHRYAVEGASVRGMEQAYNYGYAGYDRSAMEGKHTMAALVPEDVRNILYDMGAQYRQTVDAGKAKGKTKPAPKPKTVNVKADQNIKPVREDSGKHRGPDVSRYKNVQFEGDITRWGKKQQAEVEFVDFIAKNFSGNRVHVYESYKNADGKYVYTDSLGRVHAAPNGKYVGENGDIYLDLNAGNRAEGLVMNTFAHELYHHIEKQAPDQAKALAEFIAKELGEETVEAAVNRQIEKARKAGYGENFFEEQGMSAEEARQTVRDRAYSDFIADGLETMFTKGDVVQKLADLHRQDKGLFHTIRKFIRKWVSKLREFYNAGNTLSIEGRLVAELETFDKIQQMFAEALKVAGENFQAQKNTAGSGGVKYSLRVKRTNGSEALIDPEEITQTEILDYLDMARRGQLENYTYFPVSAHTPGVLVATLHKAGVEIIDKPLAMQARKARQSQLDETPYKKGGTTVRHHAMKPQEILQAINKLGTPDAIIHQRDRTKVVTIDGEKVVVDAPDNFAVFVTLNSGKECVAVIEFDSEIDSKYLVKDGHGDAYHTTVTVFEPDVIRDGEPFDYIEYLLLRPANCELEIEKESSKTETAYSETHATVSEKELSNKKITQQHNEVKKNSSRDSEGVQHVHYSARDEKVDPILTYAEIEEERQKLYNREIALKERKRKAENDPELLRAKDDYSSLFTELRTLLPKKRNGTATHVELDRIEEIKTLRDDHMKRITNLQESLGLSEIAKEETEIREEKERLRIASDTAWAREGAERENKAIAKSGLSASEYFRRKALKVFKTTNNFNEAGYLLPDGKLLDFSGGERNHRYRDHREIGEVYEATQGAAALNRFLNDGNIRIMAESPGIDIAADAEPTNEQYAAIRRFVISHGVKNKQFFVDFSASDGHRAGNYSYDGYVNAERVINDIKYYFENGEVREQSSVEKFLWSTRDTESVSNRSLLANALDSVVQDESEKRRLAEYREAIGKLEGYEKELAGYKEKLAALEGSKKPQDVKERRRLKDEAIKTANRIDIYDKKLLRLEGEKPLERVLKRERQRVLKEMQKKYGTIKHGEKAVRDDSLPVSTDGKNKVSLAARTVKGAGVTTDELADAIDAEVVQGGLTYIPLTNNKTTQKAREWLENEGWEDALREWHDDVIKCKSGADMFARGAVLLNNAAQAGNKKVWRDILYDYQFLNTTTAQGLQASRILKQLQPEDKLYMVRRSIKQMVKDMRLQVDIQLNEELVQAYQKAKTEEERDAIMAQIQQDVADQIPSTFMDKWTALRYVNMLGNLRTQGRNVIGNVAMMATTRFKDMVAVGLEQIAYKASGGKFNRTKALANNRELLKAAKNDFDTVESLVLDGGKYNDQRAQSAEFAKGVMEKQRIFKNKLLEGYRKLTNWAMDKGDVIFSKAAYGHALANYLQAHGVKTGDFSTVDPALLDDARVYAVQQAQEATFRDTNTLSGWVSTLGRKPTTPVVGRVLSEGTVPFRKTPANMLVRAEEYSPMGILNSLGISLHGAMGHSGLVNNKGFLGKIAKSGEQITGAQIVESWAKTITGTGLFALGMLLRNIGVLIGGPDDDEKLDKFEDLNGQQNYAFHIGDMYFTVDFLSPSVIPMFMGAQMLDLYQENGFQFKDLESAFTSLADPMVEMSMLQGLNDTLENVQYAENNLMQIAISASLSYLTQGLTNSMLGQIERGVEDSRRSTYVDKDGAVPGWLQSALGKASAKTPVWDYNQIPFINAWGEEEENPTVALNLIYNMLSPSYISKETKDTVSLELTRLNEVQSDVNVFPSTPEKEYDGRYLTAEEYVALARTQGQTQRQIIEKMVDSSLYDGLPDAYKAKAVSLAYQYAKESAQIEELGREGFSSDWMAEIKGNTAVGIVKHVIKENIKNMYLSGDISADEAVKRRIEYHGDTEDEAAGKVAYWDFQVKNPEYADWNESMVTRYKDLDPKTAAHVVDVLGKLEPEEGSSTVRTIQKMETITGDSKLSDEDKDIALRAIMDDKLEAKYNAARDLEIGRDTFVLAYRKYLDTEGKGKKKAILDYFQNTLKIGASNAKELYDLFDGKEKE